MEVTEDIYANTEVIEDNRADYRDSKNSYEDVYANQNSLESQRPRSFNQSDSSDGDAACSRYYKVTAVCVVLLCLLLLTAVSVLWIKSSILNTENKKLQISYNNVTEESKQLQTRYNTLTENNNQLQTRYNTLTEDNNQLQRERDGYLKTLGDVYKGKCLSFSSSLYCVSNEKKNWDESRQHCRERGADLVIINSREEQEFINKLRSSKTAWIGLSDRDREGEWKWLDNTPLSTEFWASGQPDNYAEDADCAGTGFKSDPMRNWADFKCKEEFMWICEKTLSN